MAESHTTYLPLVRFRSPGALSSWVTALLAVMDSAALFLSLSPEAAPTVPARLCLRGGFQCFNRVATAMSIQVPGETAVPPGEISLTYAEFEEAVDRLKEVGFPVERDPKEAWPDFVGWRANYEHAAYARGRRRRRRARPLVGAAPPPRPADPPHPARPRPPAEVAVAGAGPPRISP